MEEKVNKFKVGDRVAVYTLTIGVPGSMESRRYTGTVNKVLSNETMAVHLDAEGPVDFYACAKQCRRLNKKKEWYWVRPAALEIMPPYTVPGPSSDWIRVKKIKKD